MSNHENLINESNFSGFISYFQRGTSNITTARFDGESTTVRTSVYFKKHNYTHNSKRILGGNTIPEIIDYLASSGIKYIITTGQK